MENKVRAAFLDRDGVINQSVLNPATGAHEAPKRAEEFAFLPGVPEALLRLQEAGFLLVLVSNQPDAALGKATMEGLREVHAALLAALAARGIAFKAFYYCYHHPSVSACECRKPSPYFLRKAEREFGIDMAESWMVGDRETDVECGQNACVCTIRIAKPGAETAAEFTAAGLPQAVEIMLR